MENPIKMDDLGVPPCMETSIWGCNQQELSWGDWQLLLPFGGPWICVRKFEEGFTHEIWRWSCSLCSNQAGRQVHAALVDGLLRVWDWGFEMVGQFWKWMESTMISNDHDGIDGMWVNGDALVMDILMKELQPSTVTPSGEWLRYWTLPVWSWEQVSRIIKARL